MTYYIVLYRIGSNGPWWPAKMHSLPGTYESYPELSQGKERAEQFAAEFVKKGGPNYEVRVVEVIITVPEN